MYLVRPESAKLDAWGCLCYKRQEREIRFWGIVWSVITLEFLPNRFNKLTTYHWNAFSFPEWDFIGWRYFNFGNSTKFLVFTFCRSLYTCSQRFLN